MRGFIRLAIVTGALFAAAPARAQGDKAPAAEVRRDPKGIKGISPYFEEIAKGRTAFAGGDSAGAVRAFSAAISKDDKRALAYLLLAQAQLAQGDLDDALATIDEAAGKQDTEAVMSKVSFLRAELQERKADTKPGEDNAPGSALEAIAKKWEAVKTAWTAYIEQVAKAKGAPNYTASAEDRNKKIDERVKRDNDYAAVRQRIEDNEKERAKTAD